MNSGSRPVARLSVVLENALKGTRSYADASTRRMHASRAGKSIASATRNNKIEIKGHSLLRGARLRRSFLYVPAHKERFIEKALTSAADCIVLDLEDGVAPSEKKTARENIKNVLRRLGTEGYRVGENQRAELCIRVNHEGWLSNSAWEARWSKDPVAPTEDLDQDLELFALKEASRLLITAVVPKTNFPADLRHLRTVVMQKRRGLVNPAQPMKRLDMIPIIETAHAVMNLPLFVTHGKYFGAMVFAAEDYCASMGIPRTEDYSNMLYARTALVNTCKMTGVVPIDMVCQDFKDVEKLSNECHNGVYLGFEGKQTIHPDQIETINKSFAPSAEEIDWAKRLLEAVENNPKDGAFEFEGKMVDRPVFRKAENLLEKHQIIEEFETGRFVTKVEF